MDTALSNVGAPRAHGGLDRPAERPGFLDGARALFSGFAFVFTTPSVWPLALVPMAAFGLVTAMLGAGVMHFLVPMIEGLLGPRWGYLAAVIEVVIAALALIVAALVGFGVAQPLSGPALNRIVRKAEAELGAPHRPPTGVIEDMGRALQSLAVSYAFGLPVLAGLYVVTLFFPPLIVVTFPAKLVVLAILVAWDLCDYPLSIHGAPVRARVAFMGRNARAMLGFGFGLGVLSLLPCALLLVLPAGVAGAARLTRRIELFEERGPR